MQWKTKDQINNNKKKTISNSTNISPLKRSGTNVRKK